MIYIICGEIIVIVILIFVINKKLNNKLDKKVDKKDNQQKISNIEQKVSNIEEELLDIKQKIKNVCNHDNFKYYIEYITGRLPFEVYRKKCIDCDYDKRISKKKYLECKLEEQKQNIETEKDNLENLEKQLEELKKRGNEGN